MIETRSMQYRTDLRVRQAGENPWFGVLFALIAPIYLLILPNVDHCLLVLLFERQELFHYSITQ